MLFILFSLKYYLYLLDCYVDCLLFISLVYLWLYFCETLLINFFLFFILNLGRIFGTQGLIDNRKNKNICQRYFCKMVISQLDQRKTNVGQSNAAQKSFLKLLPLLFTKFHVETLSNFRIQNFSFLLSCWVRVSLDLKVFVNWSIMVNSACLLKLWLFYWKFLKVIIASTFFTPFWLSFILVLKLVSAFPTYCLLHKMNSIKYKTYLLAQLTLWNILHTFFGLLTLKSSLKVVCLQQSNFKFSRHGEHLPGFSFCICLFLTLFFSILLFPLNSLRFLFHLNAVIGWQIFF